jgi:hypothetical protein
MWRMIALVALGLLGCSSPSPVSDTIGGTDGTSGGAGTSTTMSSAGGAPTTIDVPCVGYDAANPYDSLGRGRFTGADLDGYICADAALVHLERTQASSYVGSQLLVIIYAGASGSTSSNFAFARPSDATGGMLTVMAGIGAAAPGTYGTSDGTSCGSLAFGIYEPISPTVTCPDASGACNLPYCAMQGPMLGPSCRPLTPEIGYVAKAASSCLPDSQSPVGSWTLTLTSVTPYEGDMGSSGMTMYDVHGAFVAQIVKDDTATSTSPVTAELTVVF